MLLRQDQAAFSWREIRQHFNGTIPVEYTSTAFPRLGRLIYYMLLTATEDNTSYSHCTMKWTCASRRDFQLSHTMRSFEKQSAADQPH